MITYLWHQGPPHLYYHKGSISSEKSIRLKFETFAVVNYPHHIISSAKCLESLWNWTWMRSLENPAKSGCRRGKVWAESNLRLMAPYRNSQAKGQSFLFGLYEFFFCILQMLYLFPGGAQDPSLRTELVNQKKKGLSWTQLMKYSVS